MLSKAVKITTKNKGYLATRFNLSEEHLEEMLGAYLITDFGNDEMMSFLSLAALDLLFTETGKLLANDFFEIQRK